MKKIGKIGRRNIVANKELKELFTNTPIRSCEIRLAGCMGTFALSFAHRHKRLWYRSRPDLLSDFGQVVLSCIHCHEIIERDRELTIAVFNKLRGKEYVEETNG